MLPACLQPTLKGGVSHFIPVTPAAISMPDCRECRVAITVEKFFTLSELRFFLLNIDIITIQ